MDGRSPFNFASAKLIFTAVPAARGAKGFSNGTQPGSFSCFRACQQCSTQLGGESTPKTAVASTAPPTSSELIHATIHVIPGAPGCLTNTMRSQEKSLKATPGSSNLESRGRMTRSQAATLTTVNAVNQLTLQAPSSRYNLRARGTPTTTSYSKASDDLNVVSLSSHTSTLEYVDESGSAVPHGEDADMQVDNDSEYTETGSDAYPKPPAAKRIKVSHLPKPEMVLEVPKVPEVPEVPKPDPPPNMQIKTKDAWNFRGGVNEKLPPISNIVEIFDDLTRKAMDLGLGKAIQHLGSRKLKLATMCSGTESPLLALQLVSESKYRPLNV